MLHALYFKNKFSNQLHEKFLSSIPKSLSEVTLNCINNSLLILKSNTTNIDEELKDNNCLLIGEIYPRDSLMQFNHENQIDLISYYNKYYWGNFVLFKLNEEDLQVFIPQCSQIGIFYYETNDYVVFSTEIVFFKNFIKLSLNEEYLQLFLLHGDISSKLTPFDHIYEIPSGYKAKYSPNSKCIHSPVWTYEESLAPKFSSIEDAKTAIKKSFNNVITTILNHNENIFLDLSGGLDSSSILFELCRNKSSNHNIYGINLYDPSVNSSNELEHVLKLKQYNNFNLIKLNYNNCLLFTPAECTILPNKPTIVLSHLKYQQQLNEIAGAHHQTYCFMNGHGGDSVFGCPPAIGAVADLFLDDKFSNINDKAHELAVLYRKSIWNIYATNIKLWLKHKFKNYNPSLRKATQLYNFSNNSKDQYLSLFKQLGHLNYPSEFQLCLLTHLTIANTHTNLRSNAHNIYYPLLTKPILDTALKIRSYDSFNIEYDRYLFRKSMSEVYNNSYVWRKDKGHTTGVFHKALDINKSYLTELCLNGRLINMGIVNREKFISLYNKTQKGLIDEQWALYQTLCLEIFLDMWSNHI